jgi:hypothetical protein
MSVTFLLRTAGTDMTEDTCPSNRAAVRPVGGTQGHAAAYFWLMISAASFRFRTI